MTKSRKRMLLSSIAMLLVALVALGSATFAWYYTQTTVTAETTAFSASAAEGLVIRHGISGDWLTKLEDLNTKSELTPASINYTGTASLFGGTGTGKAYDDGDLNAAGITGLDVPLNSDGSKPTSDSYFLVDTFWVASVSGTPTVHWRVKGAQVANTYLNLAIFVDGTLDKVLTSDSAASSTTKLTGADKAHAAAGGASDTYILTAMNASGVNMTDFTTSAKAAGASGTRIDIVGFADGFNSKCKSSSANIGTVSLTYEFSTVAFS